MASRPSVVIIGGGIGGLFAANAPIREGPRGSASCEAPPPGRAGLGPAVARWGARVGPGSAYFRHDGAPIAPVQVTDASGWNACFGMHRADFVALLAANLPAGIVNTGHRAVGFDQNADLARVRFDNGVVAEADVPVGAHGTPSQPHP